MNPAGEAAAIQLSARKVPRHYRYPEGARDKKSRRGRVREEREGRSERSNALPPPRWWLVRERESVVAKAKHSLAACKRPNTESHLSVPARSTPTSAAVVRFRVARRVVVATRTRRCVSRWPDQRPSV